MHSFEDSSFTGDPKQLHIEMPFLSAGVVSLLMPKKKVYPLTDVRSGNCALPPQINVHYKKPTISKCDVDFLDQLLLVIANVAHSFLVDLYFGIFV